MQYKRSYCQKINRENNYVCWAAEKANEGIESLKNKEDEDAKLAWLKGKSKISETAKVMKQLFIWKQVQVLFTSTETT